MKLFIQQSFGLGDLIFCQAIARHFISQGYDVVWPVQPHFLEGIRRAYPGIEFIDVRQVSVAEMENKAFSEQGGMLRLPLRYSESLMRRPYALHMISKYEYLGLPFQMWRHHAMPRRDRRRELALRRAIGLRKGEPFNLLQMKFGTNGEHLLQPIRVSNGLRDVVLDIIPNFSLFDWCGIIEDATTIHAVSSSSLYLFEILNLSAKELHLYCRKPYEFNFNYTKFLYTKPYVLHE